MAMNTLYKLTDENGRTKNNTQWGEGVTHRATGEGGGLCSTSFIHAYEHPLIAMLMNPIHGNFAAPRLWEAEGEIARRDGQLKCGCVELTTVREIPVPNVTLEMRVEFAIRAALFVYAEPTFVAWSKQWLDDTDRSEAAAWAAWAAAEAAAAWSAWSAAEAARAARAAEAAAEAARAAEIDLFALAEKACADGEVR